MRTWAVATVTLSLACAAGPEEEPDESTDPFGDGDADTDGDSDTDTDTDTDTDLCSGTPPVVTEVTAEAVDGLMSFEGEDLPAIRVEVSAADVDGDLDRIVVHLSWDDVLDGAVDSGDGTDGEFTFGTPACGSFEASLVLLLAVDGSRFAPATVYEFAATVEDKNGLASDAEIAQGTTPNADGTSG